MPYRHQLEKGEKLTNLFHFDTVSDPVAEIDKAMKLLKL